MAHPAHPIRYVREGTVLCAFSHGAGRPLVFLHGGLGDHRAAALTVGGLTGLRVITPDARGAGRSHWAGSLTWDQLAADTLALLDHLDLDRAVVGGVSAGAGIALRFGLLHPDRVAGLVLASPVFLGAARGLLPAQVEALDAMAAAGARCLTEGLAAIEPLFAALPEAIRERALTMVRQFDPASVAATTAFLASGAQPFERLADLGGINAPVLVIPGADAQHPSAVAEAYLAHLSNGFRATTPAAIGDFCRTTARWS